MCGLVTNNDDDNCKRMRFSPIKYIGKQDDCEQRVNSNEKTINTASLTSGGDKLTARKSLRSNNSPLFLYNHVNDSNSSNLQFRVRNPFKLVPCQKYGNSMEAPFILSLSVEALAIIDIHSHCVETEVIGLLGGKFCSKYRQLLILTAEPCESLTASTTDRQCEMDPVSQAASAERLTSNGYNVFGWYHSHPTFVENPSLRDLETQAKYQDLFAKGNQPFIALILNPYVPSNSSSINKSSLVSRYKCLMLNNQMTPSGYIKTPYAFSPILVRKEKLFYNLTWRLQDLCSRIEGLSSTLCITDKSKSQDMQYLEKISFSLRHHFDRTGLSKIETERLLDLIKDILLYHLKQKSH